MNILITGASGFIGSRLSAFLSSKGHTVFALSRQKSEPSTRTIHWDPEKGVCEIALLKGLDAVIHLAGENIANKRWTKAYKRRLVSSRCQSGEFLAYILSKLPSPPKIIISASAVGFYGNKGDEVLTEESPPGEGFLADLCRSWEDSMRPMSKRGSRIVQTRFGLVLDPAGGIFKKMLPMFHWGLGAKLGAGTQWLSWISLEDLVRAFEYVLQTDSLEGPVNFTAPEPIRQIEFARALARALHRPLVLRLPRFVLRCLLGEMADALLFSSARAIPEKLLASGYSFRHPSYATFLSSCSSFSSAV